MVPAVNPVIIAVIWLLLAAVLVAGGTVAMYLIDAPEAGFRPEAGYRPEAGFRSIARVPR